MFFGIVNHIALRYDLGGLNKYHVVPPDAQKRRAGELCVMRFKEAQCQESN